VAPTQDLTAPEPGVAPPGRRSRLDGLIGLKREHREPWLARHADIVRIALPAIALVVVLGGIIGPMFTEATGILMRNMPLAGNRGEYMRMQQPHFAGTDRKQQPYTLTAKYAVQKVREQKVYDLFQPKADLLDRKERWVAITADTGKYDQQLRMLDLVGRVTLFQDKGYILTTERARIDLDASAAYGDRPVRGQGPDAEVEAEGFHASEKGDRLVFTGRARLILKGHDDTPEAEPGPRTEQPSSGE
jgi:lipopolysaccharide export system protein LptC